MTKILFIKKSSKMIPDNRNRIAVSLYRVTCASKTTKLATNPVAV